MTFLVTRANVAEVMARIETMDRDDARSLLIECNRFISDYVRDKLANEYGWTADEIAMYEKAAREAVFG